MLLKRYRVHFPNLPYLMYLVTINKMPLIKSYLSKTHPHLRSEFRHVLQKDGTIDKKTNFQNITTFSNKRVVWKCPRKLCDKNCDHIYTAKLSGRTAGKTGCPFCAPNPLKICPCNSLESLRHDLAQEWHPKKNFFKASDVSPQSNKKIWWKCQKGQCDHHEWQSTPSTRVSMKQGCPFCAKQRVCQCYNLTTKFPNIVKEWDHKKNSKLRNPELFGPHSNKKVWWKCSKCQHSWQARINNRTSLKRGCPICHESKLEKQMNETLQQLQVLKFVRNIKRQQRLDATRMFADFFVVLPDDAKIIIEMDGIQHFIPQAFGSSSRSKEEMFAEVQRLDQAKKDWCMANHVHLLRISYKVAEKDYEAEVKDFITAIERLHQKETLFRLVHKS